MKTKTLVLISLGCMLMIIAGAVLKIEGSKWSPVLLLSGLGLQLALVALLLVTKLKQNRETTQS
ncbi:MAG: hypothetical protein E6Q96_08590 [Cyclobacteriaceae bacterium]|nr:MAG: hypothetical protein E6Q96_08590 [Cyclobacteriaceae bacterium]